MKACGADRPLYRIGRRPDPWAWPDWLRAGEDRTFGNRWDDPKGAYRVLYAGSSLRGVFIEVLARFRPDPSVLAELAAIEGDDEGALPPGHIDRSWLDVRCIGEGEVGGRFAAIGESESLAELHAELASRLVHYRVRDLDGAAIRASAPRELTQEISRWVYEQTTSEGRRAFDGIAYLSRLGDDFRNWALFEPGRADLAASLVTNVRVSDIGPEQPDFRAALALLGIRLVE
jgi:hypothetical protein